MRGSPPQAPRRVAALTRREPVAHGNPVKIRGIPGAADVVTTRPCDLFQRVPGPDTKLMLTHLTRRLMGFAIGGNGAEPSQALRLGDGWDYKSGDHIRPFVPFTALPAPPSSHRLLLTLEREHPNLSCVSPLNSHVCLAFQSNFSRRTPHPPSPHRPRLAAWRLNHRISPKVMAGTEE